MCVCVCWRGGGNNKQCINNSRTTALERSADVTRGLNYFFCQMFALDSAVACQTREKKQTSRAGFLTYMNPDVSSVALLGNNQNKHNQMKQRKRPPSHGQSAKENPHLSHGGPSQRQTSGTVPLIKVTCQGRH